MTIVETQAVALCDLRSQLLGDPDHFYSLKRQGQRRSPRERRVKIS
ncbi:hypothetical protein NON20_12265 [Synechocystis sp. B12]|nr:hypothetical protein NON20_12265 [Synechocystis sp. B12]